MSCVNYKPKRIAVAGTHGVGKTTILNKVKARNNKIETIEEQFRVLHKKHQFSKQTNLITNLIMQCQLQLENSLENKNTLADRTIFDTFIYYDYFNKSKTKLNKDLIKRYDKIYLIIPSDRAIENDNFRLTNKAEQLKISKKFEKFFKDFDNVVIVNQEQQNEVVELILKDYE